jgi:hypothetical protein
MNYNFPLISWNNEIKIVWYGKYINKSITKNIEKITKERFEELIKIEEERKQREAEEKIKKEQELIEKEKQKKIEEEEIKKQEELAKIKKEQEKKLKEEKLNGNFENKASSIVWQYWKFEVTAWTMDWDFVEANSKWPFEVIINTSASNVSSCFDAKRKLFNIMKALYTNSQTKNKIARVRFSWWGYLQASLGSSDLWFNWNDSWPTNFFTVLLNYKPYENDSWPMDRRTRGKSINGCK